MHCNWVRLGVKHISIGQTALAARLGRVTIRVMAEDQLAAAFDDLPPLELAAWRRVLTGLNLIRFAAISVLSGMACSFFLIPIVILLGQSRFAPPWLGFSLAAGIIGFFSIMPLIVFVGMLFCCRAPADHRANQFARMAVVFAMMFVLELGIASLLPHLPDWAPQLAMPVNWLLNEFDWLLIIVLIANLIVAIAAWFRFLQAVAESLRESTQAPHINEFIWWFCALAGMPLLLLVGLALLLDTRKLLRNALRHVQKPPRTMRRF